VIGTRHLDELHLLLFGKLAFLLSLKDLSKSLAVGFSGLLLPLSLWLIKRTEDCITHLCGVEQARQKWRLVERV